MNEVVSRSIAGQNSAPSVSGDGSAVVFANAPRGAGSDGVSHRLLVHTRADGSAASRTEVVYPGDDESSTKPVHGAISGDGCTIAYAVEVPVAEVPEPAATSTTTSTTTTTVAEAGGTDGSTDGTADGGTDGSTTGSDAGAADGGTDVDTGSNASLDTGEPVAAPQTAGATTELRAVNRCIASGAALTHIVLGQLDADAVLGAPALSQDGSSIAWPVGSEVRVYSSTSTVEAEQVEIVNSGVAGDVVGSHLDLSADGAVLVFESGPVGAGGAPAANVYVAVLGAGGAPSVQLLAPTLAGSSHPSISDDGALVVYQSASPTLLADAPAEGPYLVLADRTGAAADPVNGTTVQRVLTTGATDAQLAGDGASIVYNAFDSVRVRQSDSTTPFEESTEMVVNVALSSQFDESVGASISRPVLSANGEVAVFDHPAGVDLSADAEVSADGHVWAVDTTTIFEPPAPPTSESTSTTEAAASTLPVGTPPPTVRATTPRATTRNTTRTTTRRTTTTTTTTGVLSPPAFEPAAFEFAPTIVASGRRTAELTLVNPGSESIVVNGIDVQPAAAGFAVDGTDCRGTIAPGQRCIVTASFGPAEVGEATANLVATLGDGGTVTSALRGIGAPAPTLSVLPGVASNGQVVSVFGNGFPAGAIVEFSWNRGQVEANIVIDDTGSFTETLVVLPNTATGPTEMSVAGQTDLFGDVTTSVLVTGNGGGGGSAAVLGGGVGGGLGR